MINWMIEKLIWAYYKNIQNIDALFVLNIFSLLDGNKQFTFQNINLNILSKDLSTKDKGKKQVDSSQMKEFLAILGCRWRKMSYYQLISEVYAIYKKAGMYENEGVDERK